MGYDLTGWKAAVAAGTPPEKPTLFKEYVPDSVKSENGKYTFAISTGVEDRERDTISTAGWELDNYRKNPTVLWAHDYSALPVGRSEMVIARAGQLVARMEFVPAEISPFAETVRQLVEGGWLKATSVGFRPLEWKFNETRGGFDFTRQELLEFSIVPIPANPEALIAAREAGVPIGPLKEWAIKLLDSYGLSPEEKAQAAKVLHIVADAPVSVTVAGAETPIAAPHASEKSGDDPEPAIPVPPVVEKAGRVLSSANEARIRTARDNLDECLKSVGTEDPEGDPAEKTITREPRLVVIRPTESRTIPINPESVAQAVRTAVQAEVRRLRGLLD